VKSIIYARISDNVLDPEDWPVRRLLIEGEKIVDHSEMPMTGLPLCSFENGPQAGWTLEQLLAWSSVDNTGTYPEVCHDLKAEGDLHYDYINKRSTLDALIERGVR
jgi:hypothetical protein